MADDPSRLVSELLSHWAKGDEQAFAQLVPLVYAELRRVAHYQLQRERSGHTLQTTALVHEAYIRLLGGKAPEVRGRTHFVAVASRLIRQILVDYARERRAAKRDGGWRVAVEQLDGLPVLEDAELLALNDALADLRRSDERQADIVDMKFFGGLSSEEVADVLGLSRATVDRDWATARAWLHRQIRRTEAS